MAGPCSSLGMVVEERVGMVVEERVGRGGAGMEGGEGGPPRQPAAPPEMPRLGAVRAAPLPRLTGPPTATCSIPTSAHPLASSTSLVRCAIEVLHLPTFRDDLIKRWSRRLQ